ncbi:flagellar biosynthesis protein FlhB [Alteromonas aestuariivivens]|uniref:Flagellar biosynthetic protein FlhB n=1 Tax=Alteromonas aestuariivivens TaxID=1938339 RepID=A0A3D8M3N7_9ALTE|nr:EscU/YscU/HrcU family type III secretion system export apparatus switch protein [Alteromonas aestuariivivens]RDV24357.1 flagellar biosynthesis protein FlhB [Alteromonas aestuariivivens]
MKDKIKRAIGLAYRPSDKKSAPRVVSKGFGDLAESLLEQAKEAGILIHEDPYLSEMLATLDMGQEIPEALYHVIAELIAYSYMLQGKQPEGWQGQLPSLDTKA